MKEQVIICHYLHRIAEQEPTGYRFLERLREALVKERRIARAGCTEWRLSSMHISRFTGGHLVSSNHGSTDDPHDVGSEFLLCHACMNDLLITLPRLWKCEA